MTLVDQRRVERLVEQALFGPIDLTIRVATDLPTAIDRARRELVVARFLGKMAVDQGVRELRRLLEGEDRSDTSQRPRGGRGGPESPVLDDTVDEPGVDPDHIGPAPADGDTSGPRVSVPDVGDLALPDYEQLPAAHIVAKLAGLMQSERDAIEVFEVEHRHRRTILGKLDQLRESG